MSVAGVSSKKALTLAILSASSSLAFAGGLDLPTVVAGHQGTSNANGAEAADPSVIYYNPAGLALMKPGLQVSQGFSALILNGKVDVDEQGTTGTPKMSQQTGRQLSSEAATSSDSGSFWPRILGAGGLFVSMPLDGMVTAGLGVFAPGGANFNYKSNWPGAYQIDSIAVELVNINPSIGIRFDDQHNLGFGVSVLGGHIRQKTQIDVPGVAPYLLRSAYQNGAPGSEAVAACEIMSGSLKDTCYDTVVRAVGVSGTASAKVEMYGYGLGFNVGYLFTPTDNTRLGLAYRSESTLKMRGELNWQLDDLRASTIGQALIGGATLPDYLRTHLRPDTTAKGDLVIPARISASVFHKLNQKLDLMADFTFIQSSAVDKISVEFVNQINKSNGKTIHQGAGGITTNWRDSYKISVGGNYHFNDKLMLRSGFQYDKTPIKSAEFRHPGAPDSDRYMFSVGANYKFKKNLTVDAAYSLVLLDDAVSNYRDSCRVTTQENPNGSDNANSTTCTGNGGTFKGRFYDTSINVLSLQLNQRF